jgi:hypothetical protein
VREIGQQESFQSRVMDDLTVVLLFECREEERGEGERGSVCVCEREKQKENARDSV